MPTQVAIMGCGPSALFAAEGVAQAGHEPIIMAIKRKSQLFGAQYLHEAIPDVPARDFPLQVIKIGTKEGYAFKVYGDSNAPVSWNSYKEGTIKAWSLHDAYDFLWDKYEPSIQDMTLGVGDIGVIAVHYPLTLCSIPAHAICGAHDEHKFVSQEIHVQHVPSDPSAASQIIYNGEGARAEWYRFSRINGTSAWEFADAGTAPDDWTAVVTGFKPIETSCTCWLTYQGFHRIGRYGRWSKGVLTHHAYAEAIGLCSAL